MGGVGEKKKKKKLNEFTSRHRSPRRRPISARVIKRSLINKETSDCFPGLLLECRVVAASWPGIGQSGMFSVAYQLSASGGQTTMKKETIEGPS